MNRMERGGELDEGVARNEHAFEQEHAPVLLHLWMWVELREREGRTCVPPLSMCALHRG